MKANVYRTGHFCLNSEAQGHLCWLTDVVVTVDGREALKSTGLLAIVELGEAVLMFDDAAALAEIQKWPYCPYCGGNLAVSYHHISQLYNGVTLRSIHEQSE